MNLVDALCCNTSIRAQSIVELQLSHFFHRGHSSIFRAVNEFYKPRLPSPLKELDVSLGRQRVLDQLQNILIKHLPKKMCYSFALDCTSHPRLYAKTLEDKHYSHQFTAVPGQKPITIGHVYSALCYLGEEHWALPLCIDRVGSEENKITKGVQQLTALSHHEHFKDAQLVCSADSAYCCATALCDTRSHENIIFISRLKNNRVVYKSHVASEEVCRGRPRKYGDTCHLTEDLGDPSEEIILKETSKKGKAIQIKIQGWKDFLLRGTRQKPLDDKPLRIVKVRIEDDKGKPLYKYPLWLCVSGRQRETLSLESIYKHYKQRFDIEYFFKFGKTKLLMKSALTPEVEHEENWMQFVMMAMHMLYHAKSLSEIVYRPWEKSKRRLSTTSKTPFQTFRCMPDIIADIGTPAAMPKLRGLSPGCPLGETRVKRFEKKIICKTKANSDELSIKLGVREKHKILKVPINSEDSDEQKKSIQQSTLFAKIKARIESFGVQMT